MSEQKNLEIAEKSLNSINTRTQEQMTNLYADDYLADSPGATGVTLEQSRANTQVYLEAYPDLHFEVLRRIAQGDYVVLDWVATGTNSGPLRTPSGNSIPATGTKGKIYGSTTYEIKDGKIVHSWVYWDRVAMLEQLGLMPPM
jgi:steroid delta-isomerase-like uncharacterized protein